MSRSSSESNGKPKLEPVFPYGVDPCGIDEMNLAEFPIALLSDSRSQANSDALLFHGPHGNGTLTISGCPKLGLPVAKDEDVLIGLAQLTRWHSNFQDLETPFRPAELLRMMAWDTEGGKDYKRLRLALDRFKRVEFKFVDSWWNPKVRDYLDAAFDLIDDYEIDSKSRLDAAGRPQSYFRWNKKFVERFHPSYFKRLDLKTYYSLETPIAKRLFRLVDKRFFHGDRLVMDAHHLAFDRLGLSRAYENDAGKLKEKLHPHIEILMDHKCLAGLPKEELYRRVSLGRWEVQLLRGPAILPYEHELRRSPKKAAELESELESKAKAKSKPSETDSATFFPAFREPANRKSAPLAAPAATRAIGAAEKVIAAPSSAPSLSSSPAPSPAASPLAQLLIDRGIAATMAEKLARTHGEEAIRTKLAVFDWIKTKRAASLGKNPAGWLVASIENGFEIPDDYRKAQERKQQSAASDQEQIALHSLVQRIIADQKLNFRLGERIDAMTPEERTELREATLEEMSPEDRERLVQVKPDSVRDALLRGPMRDLLRRRLQAPASQAS